MSDVLDLLFGETWQEPADNMYSHRVQHGPKAWHPHRHNPIPTVSKPGRA